MLFDVEKESPTRSVEPEHGQAPSLPVRTSATIVRGQTECTFQNDDGRLSRPDGHDGSRLRRRAGGSPGFLDLRPSARAFEATVGVTPFRYLMTRRLARARDLLERTDRTALDICLDVGFKNPSHFTSRFRDHFSVTPRTFRSDRSSDSFMSVS